MATPLPAMFMVVVVSRHMTTANAWRMVTRCRSKEVEVESARGAGRGLLEFRFKAAVMLT